MPALYKYALHPRRSLLLFLLHLTPAEIGPPDPSKQTNKTIHKKIRQFNTRAQTPRRPQKGLKIFAFVVCRFFKKKTSQKPLENPPNLKKPLKSFCFLFFRTWTKNHKKALQLSVASAKKPPESITLCLEKILPPEEETKLCREDPLPPEQITLRREDPASGGRLCLRLFFGSGV